MSLLKMFDKRKDTDIYESTMKRIAVRAIITKGNKILLIHLEKSNEYKFPGGGVEDGEDNIIALKRETLEEAGVKIHRIGDFLGYVDQTYPDIYNNNKCFFQRSYYYYCDIFEEQFNLNLSANEKSYGFVPIWITLDEAIKLNEDKLSNRNDTPWTERELYVLKLLRIRN